MKVILISGKSQSGKDVVANFMKEKLESDGNKVLIIHFADPVKWLARDFYNWDGQKNLEGRYLLQNLGTTIMRTKFPTYWAEIISKFISAAQNWDYVIIPDTRFENEIETIYKYNDDVITIRIERKDKNGFKYFNPNMNIIQRFHISECELDSYNFEWYIINNGTLDDLKDSSEILLKNI